MRSGLLRNQLTILQQSTETKYLITFIWLYAVMRVFIILYIPHVQVKRHILTQCKNNVFVCERNAFLFLFKMHKDVRFRIKDQCILNKIRDLFHFYLFLETLFFWRSTSTIWKIFIRKKRAYIKIDTVVLQYAKLVMNMP